MNATKPLLFLALLISFRSFAQDSLPPVYEIKADTASIQYISPAYWEKLEDRDGEFTIAEIRNQSLTGKFHKPGTNSFFNDTVAKTHWIRFRLKNVTEYTVKISIGSGSELSDFYVVTANDSIAHFATGGKYPGHKKDG